MDSSKLLKERENKRKIYIFDLDGTLANIDEPISNIIIEKLKLISLKNKVGIASKRPIQYLLGMLRAYDIKNFFLIGENGGQILLNEKIPPKINEINKNDYIKLFSLLKGKLIEKYNNNIFIETKETRLTFYLNDKINLKDIYNDIKEELSYDTDINIEVNKKERVIDISEKTMTKKNGIMRYINLIGHDREDFELIVFGDASNDIPMFEIADTVYIIGDLEYKNKNKNIIIIKNIKELKKELSKII